MNEEKIRQRIIWIVNGFDRPIHELVLARIIYPTEPDMRAVELLDKHRSDLAGRRNTTWSPKYPPVIDAEQDPITKEWTYMPLPK